MINELKPHVIKRIELSLFGIPTAGVQMFIQFDFNGFIYVFWKRKFILNQVMRCFSQYQKQTNIFITINYCFINFILFMWFKKNIIYLPTLYLTKKTSSCTIFFFLNNAAFCILNVIYNYKFIKRINSLLAINYNK